MPGTNENANFAVKQHAETIGHNAFACIFPRFASASCNYFEFWLVHCIVCVTCDWLE